MPQANKHLKKYYPKNGVCQVENDKYIQNHGKTRDKITKLDLNFKELTGQLDLSDFGQLEELNCWGNQIKEIILPQSGSLQRLNCAGNLISELDLSKQPQLIYLDCSKNHLSSLNLSNNKLLKTLYFGNNKLTQIDLTGLTQLELILAANNQLTIFNYAVLNPQTLTFLSIGDNNLPTTDLSVFSKLVNLETLYIGNDKEEKIKKGIYNRFTGSCQSLQNLTKLDWLKINNTDINAGVEYLPVSISSLFYDTKKRPNCKLKEIEDELEEFKQNYNLYITKKLKQSQQLRKILEEQLRTLELKEEYLKTRLKDYVATNKPLIKNKKRDLLGEGAFGKVYHGIWKGQTVAIKKPKFSLRNISETVLKEIESVEKEIDLLKSLRNKYIIQYYGHYRDEEDLFVIIELAENGTLTNYIETNKELPHNWPLNLNFIKQMALGLTFLHESKIIHCDLKSLNVLICEGNIAKISDFGLSKVIDNLTISKTASKGVSGTARWMTPELLTKNKKHNTYSDIYALGMIIWEICAKKTVPFDYAQNNVDVLMCHLRGEKEEIPTDTPESLKEIITGCWENTPQERISLEQINNKLEKVNTDTDLAQIEIPPK